MKTTSFLLIAFFVFLYSCEKQTPKPQKVKFNINVQGFTMNETNFKSDNPFENFTHKLSGGTVTFINEDEEIVFETGETSISDYTFELNPGDYKLTITTPDASIDGQATASFFVDTVDVSISEEVTNIDVTAEPTCALFLVYDELDQLDQGIHITDRYADGFGNYDAYPVYTDEETGLYYVYFTPNTEEPFPDIYLWFAAGDPATIEGYFPTIDCEIGKVYQIWVKDGQTAVSSTVNITLPMEVVDIDY